MFRDPVTGTGLPSNVAGALAYVLGPLTGLTLLLIEKEDEFVRFHAVQSIAIGLLLLVLGAGYTVLSGAFAIIPVIGWLIGLLLGIGFALVCFLLWVVLMFRAFKGHLWAFPVAGRYARRVTAVEAPFSRVP